MLSNLYNSLRHVDLFAKYPPAIGSLKVGTYPAEVHSGGGYFYDDVLEYRVWVHDPEGGTYYRALDTYEAALKFSKKTLDAERPVALVYQSEHISEPQQGEYKHIRKPRITEWRVEWLKGARGTTENIPGFLAQHIKE